MQKPRCLPLRAGEKSRAGTANFTGAGSAGIGLLEKNEGLILMNSTLNVYNIGTAQGGQGRSTRTTVREVGEEVEIHQQVLRSVGSYADRYSRPRPGHGQ